MDRDQLIDLTRRAVKLARDKTTDLTPSEHRVAADTYTSTQRLAHDTTMLLASPQLVGYASELPLPGTYCTKTVMGRSILLTRGAVRAFDNVCLPRQSRIADGCGAAPRLACPYHSWTYDLDGNLFGIPGKEGFPEIRSGPAKLTELPAAECTGFLWISLDRDTTLDIPAFLGPLSDELESWGIGRWWPLGEKVLDCPINWKLAIDAFAENYHSRRNSRSREHSAGAVGSAAQHGGHLRAVPEHRVVVHHREWRVVPRLSRRRIRSVDHCAPELNSVGSVRRVGGRRRGGGLRLRACHGPR